MTRRQRRRALTKYNVVRRAARFIWNNPRVLPTLSGENVRMMQGVSSAHANEYHRERHRWPPAITVGQIFRMWKRIPVSPSTAG